MFGRGRLAHKVGNLHLCLVVQGRLLVEVQLAGEGCAEASEHVEEEDADDDCLASEGPVLVHLSAHATSSCEAFT